MHVQSTFIIHAQITQYNTHGLTRAQIPLSFEESKMAARDSQKTIHIDLLKQGYTLARARWPLVPINFCFWATGKSYFLHIDHNYAGHQLDFTGSEHWTPFNFP